MSEQDSKVKDAFDLWVKNWRELTDTKTYTGATFVFYCYLISLCICLAALGFSRGLSTSIIGVVSLCLLSTLMRVFPVIFYDLGNNDNRAQRLETIDNNPEYSEKMELVKESMKN